jgi:integrase
MEGLRQASVYGVRPDRSWRQAAIRYLDEHGHKRALERDAQDLRALDPFIGGLKLTQVHAGTLAGFIAARRKAGVKSGTVNRSLAVARRILRLCAELWRDEFGLTWLETAPMVPSVDWHDKRAPAPLSWSEQVRLFDLLPVHSRDLVEFAVHTGCREQEICQLSWEWEVELPEAFGFILPGWLCKNGRDRLVVLNASARAVVNRQRGLHSSRVFTYKGSPVASIDNSAWRRARKVARLEQVRVHDLRHTFGRRLRATGVSSELRAELLGHASGSITTHYSSAEVTELLEAVELIAEKRGPESDGVAVVKLRGVHKMPTRLCSSDVLRGLG